MPESQKTLAQARDWYFAQVLVDGGSFVVFTFLGSSTHRTMPPLGRVTLVSCG